MMQIRDEISDCYMQGIGSYNNIGNVGFIEAIGIDWVVVRDRILNKPILIYKSIEELEEFLKK